MQGHHPKNAATFSQMANRVDRLRINCFSAADQLLSSRKNRHFRPRLNSKRAVGQDNASGIKLSVSVRLCDWLREFAGSLKTNGCGCDFANVSEEAGVSADQEWSGGGSESAPLWRV